MKDWRVAPRNMSSLTSALFDSAMGILMPYLLSFVIWTTIALIINIFIGWPVVKGYMLRKAVWLWVVMNVFGAIALTVGLMAGLLSFSVAGYLLGARLDGTLMQNLLSSYGVLRLAVLLLVSGAVSLVIAAAGGLLQWLIFRHDLPHDSRARVVWLNIVLWPVVFTIALCVALDIAVLLRSMSPTTILVVMGAAAGVGAGQRIGRLAEDSRPPKTT
jgi:hypothetical protein